MKIIEYQIAKARAMRTEVNESMKPYKRPDNIEPEEGEHARTDIQTEETKQKQRRMRSRAKYRNEGREVGTPS